MRATFLSTSRRPETFWLHQKKIAEPFGVDLPTIGEHVRNIYASDELGREATLRKIR